MLEKIMPKKINWLEISLIILIIAVNLAFGLPRLANYFAVDEHLWTYGRTPRFWKSIEKQNWRKTAVNDKPGITAAAISGIGLLSINPMSYADILQEPKSEKQLAAIEKINFSFRLPIYLFSLLALPLFYFLLKKLLGKWTALISVAFIYLSPIILGISLFVNPDSLLWIFMPLSVLSFMVFQKEMKSSYAYLGGFFLGLALLTKYTATVLYIFLFLLIFLDYIFLKKESGFKEHMQKSLSAYLKLLAVSLITTAILFPAIWVDPKTFLETTFLSRPFEPIWPACAFILAFVFLDTFLLKNKVLSFLIKPLVKYSSLIAKFFFFLFILIAVLIFANTYFDLKIFDFESILNSPKPGRHASFDLQFFFGDFLSGFYALFFSLTPLVLLSLLAMPLKSFFQKNISSRESMIGLLLLLFPFFYYAGSAVSFIAPTVRYQIAVYPLISVVAAIGAWQIMVWLKDKKIFSENKHYLLAGFLVAMLLIPLFRIKPFFFAYSSELLPKKYFINSEVMGDGDFEIAEFLNQLPNSNQLKIWTDSVQICEGFAGACEKGASLDILEKKYDYYVVSSVGTKKILSLAEGRGINPETIQKLKSYYSLETSGDYKIEIDNRPKYFLKAIRDSE